MTLALTISRDDAITLDKMLQGLADLLEKDGDSRLTDEEGGILADPAYRNHVITVARCVSYDLKLAVNATQTPRRGAG
ncbi:hypothetical protein ACF09L_04930 [Streptomyces sp. NPDC014779]|uniref:hypothetical protein n=1 Tax=Streptomyces sp. NPDC014779 TaxID=3364911 RepID=UPI0036FF9227